MVTLPRRIDGRPLVRGEASGPLLKLSGPISFWGGVDPVTGTIADPRHPEAGRSIAGTVLALPAAIGSSSSSAVMLELLREGRAPAAVLIGEVDAILALGVVVGAELGYPSIPVVETPYELLRDVADGVVVTVDAEGVITL